MYRLVPKPLVLPVFQLADANVFMRLLEICRAKFYMVHSCIQCLQRPTRRDGRTKHNNNNNNDNNMHIANVLLVYVRLAQARPKNVIIITLPQMILLGNK